LSDLNFYKLLNYGGQPPPAARYDPPLPCNGYCVECEAAGLVQGSGGRLDLMSHGCDSADFEAILGPMPKDGPGLEQHILFLLENPGMNYGNGRKVKFGGHEKQPPVCHYYFAPSTNFWPEGLEGFGGNFYGLYFAYLMQKHHLTNVYITNLVKCKYHTSKGDSARTPPDINRKCMDLFLRREINYFEPKLIVCFGRAAERGFKFAYREVYPIKYLYLYHPSYICDRWRTAQKAVGETTKEKVQKALIKKNDDRLEGAIAQLA
jgi:hypothetical protein